MTMCSARNITTVASTICCVSGLLSMTVRVLSMIARAIVDGSVSAVMFHGWWILGIVVVGVVVVLGALRVRAR